MLESAGHRVVEAWDWPEAMERCLAESPDIVLMDLSLQAMEGWEAVQSLKGDPRTSGVPVIALTAQVMIEEAFARAAFAGLARYLTKPVEARQVLEEIERVLAGSPSDFDEVAF